MWGPVAGRYGPACRSKSPNTAAPRPRRHMIEPISNGPTWSDEWWFLCEVRVEGRVAQHARSDAILPSKLDNGFYPNHNDPALDHEELCTKFQVSRNPLLRVITQTGKHTDRWDPSVDHEELCTKFKVSRNPLLRVITQTGKHTDSCKKQMNETIKGPGRAQTAAMYIKQTIQQIQLPLHSIACKAHCAHNCMQAHQRPTRVVRHTRSSAFGTTKLLHRCQILLSVKFEVALNFPVSF
ncbi:hypothetical protein J6590_023990 [Homalodisca vitripennis]|nr:hypothetical protein J6590_023990 [Homalodisca vitripennis]